jgi:hypothetical protein
VLANSVAFASKTPPVADVRGADEIAERPDAFYGGIVSVGGRVTRLLPSGALILDDRLVVLTADEGQRRPRQGERITVLRPVRPFDPDQFRSTPEGLADADFSGDFANRPAIVAQSIEIE